MSNDHPNLSNAINQNLRMSEAMGGFKLEDLGEGRQFRIETKNTTYLLKRGFGTWLIKGHARYCPEWTECRVSGSTWGGSMLKVGHLGVNMHMEVVLLNYERRPRTITTTPMQEIWEEPIDPAHD